MKTFQIRITKNDNHRCLKFKSELPMESVLGAVKAVVKDTYNVSIKEIHWEVPEDRTLMWAINEAAAVRFYHKVYKETVNEIPVAKIVGYIQVPSGTTVEYNVTTNTFFNINIHTQWCIKFDVLRAIKELGLDIRTTVNAVNGIHEYYLHEYYLIGRYKIECKECGNDTLVIFYKMTTRPVVSGKFVTEEL